MAQQKIEKRKLKNRKREKPTTNNNLEIIIETYTPNDLLTKNTKFKHKYTRFEDTSKGKSIADYFLESKQVLKVAQSAKIGDDH